MFRFLMPIALASGCTLATPAPGNGPICAGTRQQRAAVAADVVASPDDRLAVSAARLVEMIDAGCAS